MQNCYDAEIEVTSTSAAQLPPSSAMRAEKAGMDTLLDSLAALSKSNGLSVIQHSARFAVVGELLVSVLTHLPVAMRADIASSFRNRIEDLMSLSDDRCLPEQYHSTLLAEVNRYLNVLR
jgi:hypothetical protein